LPTLALLLLQLTEYAASARIKQNAHATSDFLIPSPQKSVFVRQDRLNLRSILGLKVAGTRATRRGYCANCLISA
jgi:hypothetical protein